MNGVPASAKRLEIKFDGKKVCGDFSIANPEPGSSAIESADDAANDCITVTQNGTNVALGEENPVLNIPLPAGVYTKITVIAYDALTDGNALLMAVVPFEYTATNRYGTKKEATLGPVQSIFNFTFTNSETELTGVRFVRVFSAQDKLHNGTSTYGPFTASSDTDLDSPVNAGLYIENEPGDELVFQVVTKDGKVYSGSVVTPADGYEIGETYDVTADVTLYTFTISSGQKVCFSPGDLEINNDVFSFTEPFTTWGAGNTSNTEPTRRVWFDAYKFDLGERAVYGIENWRIPGYVSGAYEWDNIINRTMNDGVAAYYTVTIPGHQYCLLLPPDETISDDIGADLKSGDVTDYVKYLGKGFVLLMNTNRATYINKWSWGGATYASQGFYWAVRDSRNRYYFTTGNGNPKADFMSSRMRNHIRYVHNVK